jgi:hypothetical protein
MFSNQPWLYLDERPDQHQPLKMPFDFYGPAERELMQQRRDRIRPLETYWLLQPRLTNLMEDA